MNVCSLPRAFADTQPEVNALVDLKTGRSLTFAQLKAELDTTAAALTLAGFQPGDRAALFVATGIEFVVLVNACFQAGVVPVLIDPGMGAKNVLACVKEQQPRGLIGISKALVLRALFRGAFASVKTQVLVGGSFFPGAQSLTKLKAQVTAPAPVHAPQPDDVAAVLYTSGSTGAPKGVLYTHGMLAGQAVAIRDMFHIRPGEVDVACFLPFGLFSVAMGMTAVFPDMDFRFPAKAKPENISRALQGATSAFASPALWEPFAASLQDGQRLEGVKRILTAGAPVRPQLHERLLKHLPDGDVFTPYGATEALPVAFMNGRAVLAETAALTRQGRGTCVGTLAPNVAVKIIATTDEAIATLADARELPAGEIGEIIVRGPCVTRAYDDTHSERAREANLKSKIRDASSPEGFWHRMGDCGYLDAQGRLWFCGRKAHRVEFSGGTLHSIPVEAVAESMDSMFTKAAFVGVGPKGQQRGVVIFEVHGFTPRLPEGWATERVRALNETLKTAGIHEAVLHFGPLPVDRRHNAKIEREALSAWAAQRLAQR